MEAYLCPEWIKYNSMEINSGLQTIEGCVCCVLGTSQDTLAGVKSAYQAGGITFSHALCVWPLLTTKLNRVGLILI